jgi:hypothetical protein
MSRHDYIKIPDNIKEAWNALPDGWFERKDVDIEPLILEEMVMNGLIDKKVIEFSYGVAPIEYQISYYKL